MPKRTDISTILIIGAGPIVIGQACEFDYSGTQAVKTLKEEGYRIVLVNSNPATIMTDPEMADATYIEPLTFDACKAIIEKERPDVLLPTLGGQTALNLSMELSDSGVLEEFGVRLIGVDLKAIRRAEDRSQFKLLCDEAGFDTPRSVTVHTIEEAMRSLDVLGLPAIIRPSFTLGGSGSGMARTREDFLRIVKYGLQKSPVREVLIEESVEGWKEFELEVMRDREGNHVVVCSIENLDPMGVHTGDSVTVAPALTLTDKEYQRMRTASIAVLREIGVETGGSNVQFAVNPDNGRLVVIEMNPRVSRSSALASKATGFPIAKVAAKLAIGYTLDELTNDITGVTPASFEPTIDYVVTKIPRFAFEKYKGADPYLTTQMKSVGEAMAIGRTFQESLQKALRSLETGISGFDEQAIAGGGDRNALIASVSRATEKRLLNVAQALRDGISVEEIHAASKIDRWFLRQIAEIIEVEADIRRDGLPKDSEGWTRLKAMGFSDVRLAKLTGGKELDVRARRHKLGVRPVFKRIDTCAAEFAARTPYLYSTYETGWIGQDGKLLPPQNEAEPS
jgi:carbamoyl-phosphate synthase large subunit